MEDRRQADPLLIALDQRFRDFLERYERDQEHSQLWRMEFMKRMKEVESFVTEFKPMHKSALLLLTLVIGGTVAYWVKELWSHIKWH